MPTERKLKQVFVTFPRWEKQAELKEMLKILPPYQYAKVCEEEHDLPKEGLSDYHYHIVYLPCHAITKKKLIKYFSDKFPEDWKRIDVEGCKNLTSAITYCSKESWRVLEDGTLPTRDKSCEEPLEQRFHKAIIKKMIDESIKKKEEIEFIREHKDIFDFMDLDYHLLQNDKHREDCLKQINYYYGR